MKKTLLPLLGIVLQSITVNAATYYVSASTGDDTWTGTTASARGTSGPWKTLAKASAMKYVPGDRLLLKRGDTWNEELRPKAYYPTTSPFSRRMMILVGVMDIQNSSLS